MSCVYCEPKSRTRIVWCDTAKGLGGSSYYRSTYCGPLRPIALDSVDDRGHLERCFGATTKAVARAVPHTASAGRTSVVRHASCASCRCGCHGCRGRLRVDRGG